MQEPACEDVYLSGASVQSVIDVEATMGCVEGERVVFLGLTRQRCIDGRELVWNERGWGYTDATWSAFADDEPPAPPSQEQRRCAG